MLRGAGRRAKARRAAASYDNIVGVIDLHCYPFLPNTVSHQDTAYHLPHIVPATLVWKGRVCCWSWSCCHCDDELDPHLGIDPRHRSLNGPAQTLVEPLLVEGRGNGNAQ